MTVHDQRPLNRHGVRVAYFQVIENVKFDIISVSEIRIPDIGRIGFVSGLS